jgi:hypothetical protein
MHDEFTHSEEPTEKEKEKEKEKIKDDKELDFDSDEQDYDKVRAYVRRILGDFTGTTYEEYRHFIQEGMKKPELSPLQHELLRLYLTKLRTNVRIEIFKEDYPGLSADDILDILYKKAKNTPRDEEDLAHLAEISAYVRERDETMYVLKKLEHGAE